MGAATMLASWTHDEQDFCATIPPLNDNFAILEFTVDILLRVPCTIVAVMGLQPSAAQLVTSGTIFILFIYIMQ